MHERTNDSPVSCAGSRLAGLLRKSGSFTRGGYVRDQVLHSIGTAILQFYAICMLHAS